MLLHCQMFKCSELLTGEGKNNHDCTYEFMQWNDIEDHLIEKGHTDLAGRQFAYQDFIKLQ